jgi:hypothetical protein
MVGKPKPADLIRMGICLINDNLSNSRYFKDDHQELIKEVEQAWVDTRSEEDEAFLNSILTLLRSK